MAIREKRIECGKNYLEIDLVPIFNKRDLHAKGRRPKKRNISRPAQKNLNDKNSKRYAVQLVNGNFKEGDYFVRFSYKDEFLPDSLEAAEKEIRNGIRRIEYRIKKQGLPSLKYFLVTEYSEPDDEKGAIRIHHHLVMNSGLSRDDVENCWFKGRGKNRQRIGYCNVQRLQFNENGVEGITRYMLKDPKGKKRWSSSRNLIRPTIQPNNYKYTNRQLEKYFLSNDMGMEMFEKKYPNHFITQITAVQNEMTGIHLYLKLWRKSKDSSSLFSYQPKVKTEFISHEEWLERHIFKREYALYRRDELLARGTIREIAAERGVKPQTIFHYGTPGYKRRTNGNGLRLEKI